MYTYKTNSEEQIKQLIVDFMNSYTISLLNTNLTKIITDCLNHIKNEDSEKIFQNNIREIIQENLGWKSKDIDRNLKYREIKFDKEVKIVSFNCPLSIIIDSLIYFFILREDDSLLIINNGLKNKHPIIIDKNMNMCVYFGENQISISKIKKIEMNGFFKIDDFNINSFNRNEIVMIYNGVKNKDKKPFEYIVIESVFNHTRIPDMVKQIKDDKFILEKIIPQRILYCGIFNNKEGDNSIIDFDCDCDCIIIGIANSTFFGKDVTKNYDWDNIKDIKGIKSHLGGLESRVTSLEEEVRQLVNEVRILNSKLAQFIEEKEKEKDTDDSKSL